MQGFAAKIKWKIQIFNINEDRKGSKELKIITSREQIIHR